MIFEKDVPIRMRDGAILRANVFRPAGGHPVPVLMTHGPYGKDVHFADGFGPQWAELKKTYPGIDSEGSTGRYLRWEVADPERWIPWGYAIVVVDSRGAGESEGKLWVWSPREVVDYFDCIEWAGTQAWCTGKVGLLGISYYAVNQWQVASHRPPHLGAICPWEGASDFYRDVSHHGGIFSNEFFELWYPKQILSVQNGNGSSPYTDRTSGRPTTGNPVDAKALMDKRVDVNEEFRKHPLDDGWYKERTPDLKKINVPILSAGNWGGMGLHLRGNVEGFVGAGTKEKWLQMHGGTHWESFYLPEFVQLQKQFFDRYLKGERNGWDEQPPLILDIRHVDRFERRYETEWPLERTIWTKLRLDASEQRLLGSPVEPATIAYSAPGPGIEFVSEPMTAETEFTGPLSAVLWVSSSTADMDVFVTLRAYDPNGCEVLFRGATDPAVPIAQGWLRASHRKLDTGKTTPWRPYHAHDEIQLLTEGEIYRLDIELWPTSIVLPPGYCLALRVDGRDFERLNALGPRKGSGPFLHTDPHDRPVNLFAGQNKIHTGGEFDSYLLLPMIPNTALTD